MLRRILWYNDRGAVKWVLIAAILSLTMGYFADHKPAARAADEPAIAENLVDVPAPDAHRGS
jgi:hypothetical protein